jgi:hypothetical protein
MMKTLLSQGLYAYTSDELSNTTHTGAGTNNARSDDGGAYGNNAAAQRKQHPIPQQYLLLAGFLCQRNRADHDRVLYTNSKQNRATRKKSILDKTAANEEAPSTSHTIKTPNSFPMERMLSVFASLIVQYCDNDKKKDYARVMDVNALGSLATLEVFNQLLDQGLLLRVTPPNHVLPASKEYGSGHNGATVGEGDASSAEAAARSGSYFDPKHQLLQCPLTLQEARDIAKALNFPLSLYLTS